jgi:hypothetical protein
VVFTLANIFVENVCDSAITLLCSSIMSLHPVLYTRILFISVRFNAIKTSPVLLTRVSNELECLSRENMFSSAWGWETTITYANSRLGCYVMFGLDNHTTFILQIVKAN